MPGFGLPPGKLGFKLGDVLIGLKSGTTDVPEAVKTTDGQIHTLLYVWNPETLDFEVASGSSGQQVSVANLTETDTALRLDAVSSTLSYKGVAPVGTATATAGWKISRLTSTAGGSLTIEYADGDALYDNVWDDRAGLSYS